MTYRLTIVIVTFGATENLARCLSSLAAQSFHEFDVVLVSNAGSKEAQGVISGSPLASRTRLVVCAVNRGYGAACNLGARSASAPLIVFLNDDTYFGREWLSELYKSLKANENSIIQSTIFHESVNQTRTGNPCDIYGAAGISFYRGCGTGEFYASGASLAMSKRVFESLGGFDEVLFMYHEDVDLSWRGRIMGFEVSAAAGAICHHLGGSSSRTIPAALKFYFTQRNRIRVLIKNYSARKLLVRLAIACSLILTGAIFLALRTLAVEYVVHGTKALIWNLRVLRRTLTERHRIQGRRVQPDTAIEKSMSPHSMDICVLKRYISGRPNIVTSFSNSATTLVLQPMSFRSR